MVELIINNNLIELPKSASVKYTKQISDIFDIANVAVSFTNTLEFEKTPANTQAMQFLGIPGDRSLVPYQKNNGALKVDGFDLISEGWFVPSNTDDNYKGAVYDGMIDFFKAIENKTIGKDLDLANFNHEKLLSTVVDSFTNEYYQYIIADYGGKNIFDNGINIDYQAPSFSVRKLWELIFSTFSFNCDYTNLSYIDGLYITYPKDTAETAALEQIAVMSKTNYVSQDIRGVGGISQPSQFYSWSTSVIDEGYLINNWKYVIPETTSYNFKLEIEMYVKYRRPNYYNPDVNVQVEVLRNGVVMQLLPSDFKEHDYVGDLRELDFNQPCTQGDIIEIKIWAPQSTQFRGRNYRCYEWHHNSSEFTISKTDLGTTRLEEEFKDFLIKDFFKEILWRTALTPVFNKLTNTVEFKTIESRINFDNSQDLSDYYVKRTNETYTNGYAQKNVFALKKNDDTDLTGDGYLYVPNKNIEDEKVLASSKIYAPDKKILTQIASVVQSNQYKIWETEIKENETTGENELSYKGLSGRFYFIRKNIVSGSYKLTSEKLNDEQIVSFVPVAVNENTLFEEAVYNNYSEYQKIFDNFRIHNIDLALSIDGFNALDLTIPVYIKQENAYYICNKVTFQEGENSSAEFIKINNL